MRGARLIHCRQFIKFCVVGASGVVVDMVALHFFTDASWCGLNVTLGKFLAAEIAMLNNFLWNDRWTFRGGIGAVEGDESVFRRLLKFHAICGFGIFLAVILLNVFYLGLHLNLYVANLIAIVAVTFWNFTMNAAYNWRQARNTGR